ncbi:MAG: RNA 3'-terminal phosphate cyclase [Candidatus Micrarchaeota archaeon]
MITIDGSHREGGGQIIRTALTLSALTGKPFEIDNIRANRPNPGLQPQHLMAVKAARSVCRGTMEGAEVGSSTLKFNPVNIIGGKYDFNIGTAGSVTLVAQTILPLLLHAKKESKVRIIGGTHVMKSPGYDYFEKVFIPAVKQLGAKVESKMIRAGFYPKGGGDIELLVKPSQLRGCSTWLSASFGAMIVVGSLEPIIAIREKKVFMQHDMEKNVFIRNYETFSPGNAVTAWRGFNGAYALGEKGKRAEVVAQEAIDELKKQTAEVDRHLADQLLLYAVLAEGETSFTTSEITEHLKTNAEIISLFSDRQLFIDETEKRVTIK